MAQCIGYSHARLAWLGLNYSFIYTGERYNQQENIRYNYAKPWYTSDVSLLKTFTIGKSGNFRYVRR